MKTEYNYNRYITKLADRYSKNEDESKDLYQEGQIALHIAKEKYDPTKGDNLHSFALVYIRSAMFDFLTHNARTIRIPAHQQNENNSKFNEKYPTNIPTVSTSTPLGDESNETIGDMLAADEVDDVLDDVYKLKLECLSKFLLELKDKEREVFKLRNIDELNYDEIAEKIGVTKQRVSQLYKIAVEKLQDKFGLEKIKTKNKRRYNK